MSKKGWLKGLECPNALQKANESGPMGSYHKWTDVPGYVKLVANLDLEKTLEREHCK